MKRISTLLLVAVPALALSGCLDSSGTTTNSGMPPPQAEPQQTTVSLGDVPDHGLETTAEPVTLVPGGSRTLGNVVLTCPTGGAACAVSVIEAADGTVTVTSTGGAATVGYSDAYNNDIASNPLITKWQQFSEGTPTLTMTVNHALATLNSINRRLTHGFSVTRPGDSAAEISERPENVEASLEPITELSDVFSFNPVLAHNGVGLMQIMYDLRDESDAGYERQIGEQYWAFLDYSRFIVLRGRSCALASVEACDEQQFTLWDDHYAEAYSDGLYSATNPTGSGSASWAGIMTGWDVGSYEAPSSGPVLGEATVDIDDLSDPDVDVSFTHIYDMTGGIRHPDMHWSDLALTDGAFTDGAPRTISGAFYGPRQQEAGGVFHRDGITGAFGARGEESEVPAERSDIASAIADTLEAEAERATPAISGASHSMVTLTSPPRYAHALPYHDDSNALVIGASIMSAAEIFHPLVSYQGRSIIAETEDHGHGLGEHWRLFEGRNNYSEAGTFTAVFATDADDSETLGQPWVGYGVLEQVIAFDDVPDPRAGHDWQGISFSPYPEPGLHGSLDGRAGIFTCESESFACNFEQGENGWHPRSQVAFLPDDGGEAVVLYPTYSNPVATVDHLTFGYWLYVPENVTEFDPIGFGVLAGGGDPFDMQAITALTDSATYSGSTVGMYYRAPTTAGADTGSFEGAVTLTANFGTIFDPGSVSGFVRNITYEEPTSSLPTALQLQLAAIDPMRNDPWGALPVTGSVVAAGTNDAWQGSWAAAFYGNGLTASDHPTGVAGTFGASTGDAGLVGSFGARRLQ
ncbi:MAG: hypothetical protein OXP75_01530 [Rhodospirillales bacterium]|nr:hypothetical protein [Rhodospirillales bacterium]